MKHKKIMVLLLALLLLTALCCTSAFAANGDVASAVEETWKEAAKQIKSVVETVVFPALNMILAIAFLEKLGDFPYMGAQHPDPELMRREYRKVICGDYVCVYKVIGPSVYVYRVVNGRTDYPKLLK